MHDPRRLSVHFHIHRSRPCLGFLRRPPGRLLGPPLPARALPASPVASTGSGPEAWVVTRDGDLADCAVGEDTDGGGRRSWRKQGAPGGRGRQSRRDPWPPSPRRSAEGRKPEPDGGWSWQVDPLLPPALRPRAGPSPLVAATTYSRALVSQGFLGLHEPGHSLAGPFLASLLR